MIYVPSLKVEDEGGKLFKMDLALFMIAIKSLKPVIRDLFINLSKALIRIESVIIL